METYIYMIIKNKHVVIYRKVRICFYEIWDSEQRHYKITGSKQLPKSICKARIIGTWKVVYKQLPIRAFKTDIYWLI